MSESIGEENIGDMYMLNDERVLFVVDARSVRGNRLTMEKEGVVFAMHGPCTREDNEMILPVVDGVVRLGHMSDYMDLRDVKGVCINVKDIVCMTYEGRRTAYFGYMHKKSLDSVKRMVVNLDDELDDIFSPPPSPPGELLESSSEDSDTTI